MSYQDRKEATCCSRGEACGQDEMRGNGDKHQASATRSKQLRTKRPAQPTASLVFIDENMDHGPASRRKFVSASESVHSCGIWGGDAGGLHQRSHRF